MSIFYTDTGSASIFTITGLLSASVISASNFSGTVSTSVSSSYALSASYAPSSPSISASYALSASFTTTAITSSYITSSNIVGNVQSSSFSITALTSSYATNFTASGNASINHAVIENGLIAKGNTGTVTNPSNYGQSFIGNVSSPSGWNGSGFALYNSTAGSNILSLVANNDILYLGEFNDGASTNFAQFSAGKLDVTGDLYLKGVQILYTDGFNNLNVGGLSDGGSEGKLTIGIGASTIGASDGAIAIGYNSSVGGGASNSVVIGQNVSTTTSNVIVLGNGQNVGINKDAPTYPLDVTGDINFTGNLYKSGVLFNGASNKVTSSVDFGFSSSFEGAYALTTVSASWVTTASVIDIKVTSDSSHHSVEDSVLEGLTFSVGNIINGSSFDIYSYAINGTWGIYNVTAVEL